MNELILLQKNCFPWRPTLLPWTNWERKPFGISSNPAVFIKIRQKNIAGLSHILVEQYHGEVPSDRESLESLPGIGRKSANVVMSVAFGIPALAVDTHVFRVSRRMGFSDGNDVLKVEQDLMDLIPESRWCEAHHWLIFHGEKGMQGTRPFCDQCP